MLAPVEGGALLTDAFIVVIDGSGIPQVFLDWTVWFCVVKTTAARWGKLLFVLH